jgi:hypothetical protein
MNDDAVRNSFFENGIKAVTHKQAQLRKQKSKQLSKKARETRHHWWVLQCSDILHCRCSQTRGQAALTALHCVTLQTGLRSALVLMRC